MKIRLLILLLLFPCLLSAHPVDLNRIYSYALQGNVKMIIDEFNSTPEENLTEDQRILKHKYTERFMGSEENFDYKSDDKLIIELSSIYHQYWKNILLKKISTNSADSLFKQNIAAYLKHHDKHFNKKDTIDQLASFLHHKGYYTALGKTAGIYDFLIWRKENKVTYQVTLPHKTQKVKVIFMEDPVAWGWEEYATFGKYYPGGWATDKALHCVKQAYDLSSEIFKVSYLQHEAMHFSDYKTFPGLSGSDLEYRAKLIELSYAESTLYSTIRFFLVNSVDNDQNPHAYANFCVIRDLSKKIFGQEEKDHEKWKTVSAEKIHAAALELIDAKNISLSANRRP